MCFILSLCLWSFLAPYAHLLVFRQLETGGDITGFLCERVCGFPCRNKGLCVGRCWNRVPFAIYSSQEESDRHWCSQTVRVCVCVCVCALWLPLFLYISMFSSTFPQNNDVIILCCHYREYMCIAPCVFVNVCVCQEISVIPASQHSGCFCICCLIWRKSADNLSK